MRCPQAGAELLAFYSSSSLTSVSWTRPGTEGCVNLVMIDCTVFCHVKGNGDLSRQRRRQVEGELHVVAIGDERYTGWVMTQFELCLRHGKVASAERDARIGG